MWNESQFHTDRGDNAGHPTGERSCNVRYVRNFMWPDRRLQAFAVHHQDSLKPNVFDAAPSRPPSRNSVNVHDGYFPAGGQILYLQVIEGDAS